MKNAFLINVTSPKNSGLSPRRISRLLKHLIHNGQQLCHDTINDTDCDATVETNALKLTIGAPKPFEQKAVRIAIFIDGGNVRDVYANVKGIDVTLIDHDTGEIDEAVADKNQRVVESMSTEFPFNCY